MTEAHTKQPRPCSQALPSGVAVTDDCQHKGCLGSGVCAAGAVVAVQIVDEVLLPTILHQVHLHQALTCYVHMACCFALFWWYTFCNKLEGCNV